MIVNWQTQARVPKLFGTLGPRNARILAHYITIEKTSSVLPELRPFKWSAQPVLCLAKGDMVLWLGFIEKSNNNSENSTSVLSVIRCRSGWTRRKNGYAWENFGVLPSKFTVMHHGCEINFLFMIKMKMIAKYPCRAVGKSENPKGWGVIQGLLKRKVLLIFLPKSGGAIAPMLFGPDGPVLITLSHSLYFMMLWKWHLIKL